MFKVFLIRAHQTAHVFTALKPDAVIRTRQPHSSNHTPPFLRSLVPYFPASAVCYGGLSTAGLRKKEIWTIAIPALIFTIISQLLHETHEWQHANLLPLSTFHFFSIATLILSIHQTLQMSILHSLTTYFTKVYILDDF